MNGKGSNGFLQRLLVTVAGFLIAFILAEIGTRLWLPQQFPIHPPDMYRLDPDLGYRLAPDYSGLLQRPEFAATFSTNELGFRGSAISARQPNTYRVLVLGDSMAFGFGVADTETFPYLLEQQLQLQFPELAIEVINGAVPGYGTADELNFLQQFGPGLMPDLILVQFFSVNDLAENLAPAGSWATLEDGMLAANPDGANPDQGFSDNELLLSKIKQQSQFANLLSNSLGYLLSRTNLLSTEESIWGESFDSEMEQLGQDLLVNIASEGYELGAKTLLLYSSGQNLVIQPRYSPARSLNVVATASATAEVPWIDLAEKLQAREDRLELYYPQDGHWTAQGHSAVADILLPELQQLIDERQHPAK